MSIQLDKKISSFYVTLKFVIVLPKAIPRVPSCVKSSYMIIYTHCAQRRYFLTVYLHFPTGKLLRLSDVALVCAVNCPVFLVQHFVNKRFQYCNRFRKTAKSYY